MAWDRGMHASTCAEEIRGWAAETGRWDELRGEVGRCTRYGGEAKVEPGRSGGRISATRHGGWKSPPFPWASGNGDAGIVEDSLGMALEIGVSQDEAFPR